MVSGLAHFKPMLFTDEPYTFREMVGLGLLGFVFECT